MTIYIVKKDDTLNSIANNFNLSTQFLIDYNSLDYPDDLVVGQTIIIPDTSTTNTKLGTIATNGYLYPNINLDILSKTLPFLTFATIFTYGFNSSGELIVPDDQAVLDIILNTNTKPILLISTLGSDGQFSNELANLLLNNAQIQDNLINNLLEIMSSKKYYAVDIDFEYVLPEDKNAFVNFINKVTRIFNYSGYPVMTSLAPKVSADQQGLLYEAHDYNLIGKVSDAVLLMTYEWGYTYGPPMAVAPLNAVKKVLDYAISEIPENKIFMGIPNYGYDWKLPYIKGESKAQSIGNTQAIDIARENNASILYDETAQSPYFSYYQNNSFTQEAEEHIVWFEDARSIQAKFLTAYQYKFTGLSFWNIMRYFPQNWIILNQMFEIYKIK